MVAFIYSRRKSIFFILRNRNDCWADIFNFALNILRYYFNGVKCILGVVEIYEQIEWEL